MLQHSFYSLHPHDPHVCQLPRPARAAARCLVLLARDGHAGKVGGRSKGSHALPRAQRGVLQACARGRAWAVAPKCTTPARCAPHPAPPPLSLSPRQLPPHARPSRAVGSRACSPCPPTPHRRQLHPQRVVVWHQRPQLSLEPVPEAGARGHAACAGVHVLGRVTHGASRAARRPLLHGAASVCTRRTGARTRTCEHDVVVEQRVQRRVARLHRLYQCLGHARLLQAHVWRVEQHLRALHKCRVRAGGGAVRSGWVPCMAAAAAGL